MHKTAFVLVGLTLATCECRRSPKEDHALTAATPQTQAPSEPAAPPVSADPLLARLCAFKSACTITRRRSILGPAEVQIVDVRIERAAGLSDEETCNRRQYWVIPPHQDPLLLAEDCEVQPSADSLGSASTSLEGGDFVLKYLESESNDGCEKYEVRVRLSPKVTVLDEKRWVGQQAPVTGTCRALKREVNLSKNGSGTAQDPLLKLHR